MGAGGVRRQPGAAVDPRHGLWQAPGVAPEHDAWPVDLDGTPHAVRRAKRASSRARAGVCLAALALGCGPQGEIPTVARDVPFACQTQADCGAGECLAELGICTRRAGQLSTLLFEVTPQAADPVYGGARFVKIMDIGSQVPMASPLELNVRPRVPVRGRVIAALDQAACLTISRSTLPVTLTFTPRQRLLGLSLPSYELSTRFLDEPIAEYEFEGALPPGRYDVYVQPILAAQNEGCRAIPQIFRDQAIEEMSGQALQLQQPTPASLRLSIVWRDNLDGWLLDMIHPVTGEVISNRVRLSADDVSDSDRLDTTLNYSRAENDFIGPTGEELVRLTPPPGVLAGTVLLVRSGLEIITSGEGVIGDVSSFGTRVELRAWVWKKGEPDTPVPGTVSFSALDLDEVPEGVSTSFEGSGIVSPQGQVGIPLLPGRYRFRVTPPAVPLVGLGLMAGYQSELTVYPPADAGLPQQSGQVIEVPSAISISGQVVAAGAGSPIAGVEVRASASSRNGNSCVEGPEGEQALGCERELPPVLHKARAQDPFVPRTRNSVSQSDGSFTIDGLDCGQCKEGAGARFDLTVRPDIQTGLPWFVLSAIDLHASQDEMGPLEMPMPVARPMRVTYGDPLMVTGAGGAPVSQPRPGLGGARVRVFAMLDDRSEVVSDPEGLASCVALPPSSDARCLQSLLQVAEVRTGTDGEFLLLLPPEVK